MPCGELYSHTCDIANELVLVVALPRTLCSSQFRGPHLSFEVRLRRDIGRELPCHQARQSLEHVASPVSRRGRRRVAFKGARAVANVSCPIEALAPPSPVSIHA